MNSDAEVRVFSEMDYIAEMGFSRCAFRVFVKSLLDGGVLDKVTVLILILVRTF